MKRFAFVLLKHSILFLFVIHGLASGSPDSSCIVSILNRTIGVRSDKSFDIPNIPAGLGKARVRAICLDSLGEIIIGYSPYLNILPDISNNAGLIRFDDAVLTLKSLTLTLESRILSQPNDQIQIRATANFSNDSITDVTLHSGIEFRSTNSAVARIDSSGTITALSSGQVLIIATFERTLASLWVQVQLGNDSDGDGLPDDWETTHGLDPNGPLDALDNPDFDGLSNFQEFQQGTHPGVADTDRDGIQDGEEVIEGKDTYITNALNPNTDGDPVPDGLEVQSGTDPTNPNSYNLAALITSVEVTPSNIHLIFNTVFASESFRQLRVIGNLRGGGTMDLTDLAFGTSYTSSNLTIANFGPESGRIYAGQPGSAAIRVRNGPFEDTIPVTVESFSPQSLSRLSLSGPPTNVEVQGSLAFVSAGSSGVHIIDVSDPAAPVRIATYNTPGFAHDLKVADTLLYVADGGTGIVILDIQSPASPSLVRTLDTPGDAQDVSIRGSRLYLADGSTGGLVFDLVDPSSPRLMGTLVTPGPAIGMDADEKLIAVACGGHGVALFATAPNGEISSLGRVATTNALDVVLDKGFTFVADYNGSLRVIEVGPFGPMVVASTSGSQAGYLLDLTVRGDLLFGADIFFVNGVPIVDITRPSQPLGRTTLNFPGDATGTGVAVDDQNVYLAADDGHLYIGQYQRTLDAEGFPPSARFLTPDSGQLLVRNEQLSIRVEARDDIAVRKVDFYANGVLIGTDPAAPFQVEWKVPANQDSAILETQAIDYGDNVSHRARQIHRIGNDPGTTLVGQVLGEDGVPRTEVQLTCGDSVWVLPPGGAIQRWYGNTVNGPLECKAVWSPGSLFATSGMVQLRRGGESGLGNLVLGPLPMIIGLSPRYALAGSTMNIQVVGRNMQGAAFQFKTFGIFNLPVPIATISPNGQSAQFQLLPPATVAGNWVLMAHNGAGTSDSTPNSGNLLKVVIGSGADPDEDGLTNGEEVAGQTDPTLADTDGDGFADGFERAMSRNPLDPTDYPSESTIPRALGNVTSGVTSLQNQRQPDYGGPAIVREVLRQQFSLLNGFTPPSPIPGGHPPPVEVLIRPLAMLNTSQPPFTPPSGINLSLEAFHYPVSLLREAVPDFSLPPGVVISYEALSSRISTRNEQMPSFSLPGGGTQVGVESFSRVMSMRNEYQPQLTLPVGVSIPREVVSRPASLRNVSPPQGIFVIPHLDLDSDRDGLSDNREAELGTDVFNRDSDGDGYWDGEEDNFGTDSLDPEDKPSFPPMHPPSEALTPAIGIKNEGL